MSSETNPDLQLEIGHVLFIDIVGYSKFLINEQSEVLRTLNEAVRQTKQFRAAEANGGLIRLPTGDGMALVFLHSLEAPALCALEISKALQGNPKISVRMGIHSGPVNQIADVNEQLNLTGAGINIACRVMDCGDAGHILLSKRVAEDLVQYRHWEPHLHDLGRVTVKHGVEIGLVNLYNGELGNPARPEKLRRAALVRRRGRKRRIALVVVPVALLAVGGFLLWRTNGKIFPGGGDAVLNAKSIAVMPFENRSEDASYKYFADGIQDEILTRLAKIGALKVISRTSTQHYKSAPENLREIAKQLGVASVVEGSVQKAGDAVRINVQLIQAETDSHLWAETYDRKVTDLLAVESEVATAIAAQLQAKLTGSEQTALNVKLTDNPDAYDAYLRGLALEGHAGFLVESLEAKVKNYGKAVELDPNFSQAWARLSSAHVWTYFQFDRTPQRLALAREALDNALRLAPDSGETLIALGTYRYGGTQDYQGAFEAYGQARERLPNSSEVLLRMGSVARRLGRWEEALKLHTQAAGLDPRSTECWKHQGFTLRGLSRYPEAITAFDHALQAAPGDPDLIYEKAITLQMAGELKAAGELLDSIPADPAHDPLTPRRLNQWIYERQYASGIAALKAGLAKREKFAKTEVAEALFNLASLEILGGDTKAGMDHAAESRDIMEALRKEGADNPFSAITHTAQTYALLGDHAAALREAERAMTAYAADAFIYPQALVVLARVQAMAGDNESAMATLERSMKMPCAYGATPALLRLEPIWDSLRGDPRFVRLASGEAAAAR